MSISNVLVTGAYGFVGKAICQLLNERNFNVTGLVRSFKYPIKDVRLFESDLTSEMDLSEIMSGVDCIVHLAGRAHILKELEADPMSAFMRVNCEATVSLARQAISASVKRFVFVSSIGVNGDSTNSPFTEESIPEPSAFYAISKYQAEQKLKALFKGTNTDLVIVRPPLVYGVGAEGNFSRLLKLTSLGFPLPFKYIDNSRSFISIGNLASLLVTCVDHPAAKGELFLASDGVNISTPALIAALSKGMNKKILMLPVPLVILSVLCTACGKKKLFKQLTASLEVDSTKAQRLLGWSPDMDVVGALEKIGLSYIS